MDRRIRAVIAFMNANLHRKLTVKDMARAVNLSPSHLARLFKREAGKPVSGYLRGLRLERAKELLETTFLSVKQVAGRVGLTSIPHFVTNFKRAYGVTPARYAERYRKTMHT